jgi:glycosyltransferase involved in cell wall biosynthesis
VTISHTRQKQLSQLFNIPTEEIRVIPNGIDAAQFLSLGSHAQQLVDQFNLLLADPLLLLPARLTRRKNIPFAIHAISGLRDRMPKVRLLVTGPPGPHNPKNIDYFNELLILRKSLNLEQHVLFLAEHAPGFISGRTVQDLYKLADALFLPSLEEGFGLPILEAGLTGLPIFCSQIAPFEEILGKDAYYFDPKGDPSRASDLIAEQLNGNLTYRLRKRIQGLYSWSGIYRNHLQSLVES